MDEADVGEGNGSFDAADVRLVLVHIPEEGGGRNIDLEGDGVRYVNFLNEFRKEK